MDDGDRGGDRGIPLAAADDPENAQNEEQRNEGMDGVNGDDHELQLAGAGNFEDLGEREEADQNAQAQPEVVVNNNDNEGQGIALSIQENGRGSEQSTSDAELEHIQGKRSTVCLS